MDFDLIKYLISKLKNRQKMDSSVSDLKITQLQSRLDAEKFKDEQQKKVQSSYPMIDMFNKK